MTSGGRKLRGLTATRVIRAFEKAGFYVSRVAGSHYVLKHAERPTLIIPRHDPVKAGLLLGQVKRSGLTIEEFEDLV